MLLVGTKAKAISKAIVSNSSMTKEPYWSKWDALFKKYASQFGVDWRWLKAIAMNESALGTHPSVALGLREPSNPKSVSDDKLSWGLMQVKVDTANDMEKGITFKDLNNPETAIRIGAKYIAFVKTRFPRDSGEELTKKVIMSYNQGYGNTLKGKTYAAPYWERFQRHMALINSKP